MFSINLMLPTMSFITESFIFSTKMQKNMLSFILEYLTLAYARFKRETQL